MADICGLLPSFEGYYHRFHRSQCYHRCGLKWFGAHSEGYAQYVRQSYEPLSDNLCRLIKIYLLLTAILGNPIRGLLFQNLNLSNVRTRPETLDFAVSPIALVDYYYAVLFLADKHTVKIAILCSAPLAPPQANFV